MYFTHVQTKHELNFAEAHETEASSLCTRTSATQNPCGVGGRTTRVFLARVSRRQLLQLQLLLCAVLHHYQKCADVLALNLGAELTRARSGIRCNL